MGLGSLHSTSLSYLSVSFSSPSLFSLFPHHQPSGLEFYGLLSYQSLSLQFLFSEIEVWGLVSLDLSSLRPNSSSGFFLNLDLIFFFDSRSLILIFLKSPSDSRV